MFNLVYYYHPSLKQSSNSLFTHYLSFYTFFYTYWQITNEPHNSITISENGPHPYMNLENNSMVNVRRFGLAKKLVCKVIAETGNDSGNWEYE